MSSNIPQYQVTSWVIQKDQTQAGLTNPLTSARLSEEVHQFNKKPYMKRLFVPPSSYNADQPQPWMRYTRMGHLRKSLLDNDPSYLRMITGNNQQAYQGNNLYPSNMATTPISADEPVQSINEEAAHGDLLHRFSKMAGLREDALLKKVQEITGSAMDDMRKREMAKGSDQLSGRPPVLDPYHSKEEQLSANKQEQEMEQIVT